MDDNTKVIGLNPDNEAAVATIDPRDAKIARLAEAWDRALGELFGERAAA